MFELKEFNRAAHIIRNSGLEKVNLSCLYLYLLCLYHKQQYQEALNLLDNLDLEYLSTSLLGKDETEQEINAADTSDPPKDVSQFDSLTSQCPIQFCIFAGYFRVYLSNQS